MAALTLKNIPDEIYSRLKQSAENHRRSLNQEAIACLEQVLAPERIDLQQRIAEIRKLRSKLPAGKFKARDILRAIENGRS